MTEQSATQQETGIRITFSAEMEEGTSVALQDAFLTHIEKEGVLFGGGLHPTKIEGSVYSDTKTIEEIKQVIRDFVADKQYELFFIDVQA